MIRVAAARLLLFLSSVVLRSSVACPPPIGFFSSLVFPSGELVLMEFPQECSTASAHGDPNHSLMSGPFPIPESQRLSKQVGRGILGSRADLLITNNLAAYLEILISLHPGCAAHSGPLHQILVHWQLFFFFSWVQAPTFCAIPSLTGMNEISVLSFLGPYRSQEFFFASKHIRSYWRQNVWPLLREKDVLPRACRRDQGMMGAYQSLYAAQIPCYIWCMINKRSGVTLRPLVALRHFSLPLLSYCDIICSCNAAPTFIKYQSNKHTVTSQNFPTRKPEFR